MGNSFDLSKYVEVRPGVYVKKSGHVQPRDIGKRPILEKSTTPGQGGTPVMHKVSLVLFGDPMPKQSTRFFNDSRTGKLRSCQPQKMVDRKDDYQRQIREQLPPDFKMFENEVHLRKFHCVFPPLKAFHKIKGRMDAIRAGEIFYKASKPDLIDNLKKLAFDSMSGIVQKDDSIVVTENDTAKYYGVGGCIIIELEGY